MRRHPSCLLIPTYLPVAAGLLFFLIGGGSQAALFERNADNLQQEAAAAHAEGKQLAVVLTVPDCPGCLEMEKTVYRDRRTEKLIEGRFRTVRLDLSRSAPIIDTLGRATPVADFAKRLRAVATPSLVFFAGDGSFAYRYTGTLDQAGLRDLADYVVRAKFEEFPFAPRDAARGNLAARQDRALHASPPAGNLPLYPEFALAASDGRERRLADFRGQVVALSVGYTQWPDVCSTKLIELKAGVQGLATKLSRPIPVLFAPVEPDRDSLAKAQGYVGGLRPTRGAPSRGVRKRRANGK